MTDLTVKGLAEALNVSLPTVWKYIKSGNIHAYKVGRAVRIPYTELDRIREDNRIEGSHE